MTGGVDQRAKAADFTKISYPEFRTTLLSEWENATEEIEWLVEAGAYLRACWLKEANHLKGRPLDEAETKPLWDDFTQAELTTLRGDARVALKKYTRAHVLEGVTDNLRARLVQAGWQRSVDAAVVALRAAIGVLFVVLDALKQMYHGVLHLLGIVLFAGLMSLLWPDLWAHAQDTLKAVFGIH